MAKVNFAIPSFGYMAAELIKEKAPVQFVTATPSAVVKHSEPMNIVALHYDQSQRQIRAVGADGNVRVCKIDRLQSINHARTLWAMLQGAKRAGTIISFMAAGGFSPDRWFFDICAE
jgi:hypothetical protein